MTLIAPWTPWRIYISGPISGLDREFTRATFDFVSTAVAELGHIPINPMEIPAPDNCGCGIPAEGFHEWECCLRKDILALIDCDAILMMPGWNSSKGAALEHHIATQLSMRIYHNAIDIPRVEKPDIETFASKEGNRAR